MSGSPQADRRATSCVWRARAPAPWSTGTEQALPTNGLGTPTAGCRLEIDCKKCLLTSCPALCLSATSRSFPARDSSGMSHTSLYPPPVLGAPVGDGRRVQRMNHAPTEELERTVARC